jgi:two-component system response regulator HydG
MAKTNNEKQVEKRRDVASVLIVDNDTNMARFLLEILAQKGLQANLAGDKRTALDLLGKNSFDLAFISETISPSGEVCNQSTSNLDLLREIRANSPELPVIMMADVTRIGTMRTEALKAQPKQCVDCSDSDNTVLRRGIERAVQAIRAGCCDFLIKPLERQKTERLLETFLPNHSVSTVASARQGNRCLYQIVGKSPKLTQTVSLAKRIAPTSAPVLISGESGTGKELISFLIHHKSKRALGPYVRVNCAALSDSLLESELFGHEKGAFTGAYAQRKGRFEMAHGGTLLLDEISETPLRFQAKLLRILELQEFERVGGNDNIKVDVRIISTTNKDLLQEVQLGRFRQDLYYRLNGVRLVVSPLRERVEDLTEFIWHFVNLYARQTQRRITKLDPTMMEIFTKYHWPGNVRQLRNVVLTSLILGYGQTLSLADVSWLFDELQPLPQHSLNDPIIESIGQEDVESRRLPLRDGLGGVPLEQVERQAILDTLQRTNGNRTRAAKVLGISDRTLREKIRRYRQQQCQPTSV